jgi:hypothetical protein
LVTVHSSATAYFGYEHLALLTSAESARFYSDAVSTECESTNLGVALWFLNEGSNQC